MSFCDQPRRSSAIFNAVPRTLMPSPMQCTSSAIGFFFVPFLDISSAGSRETAPRLVGVGPSASGWEPAPWIGPKPKHPPPRARWPGAFGSWLAGHCPWVLIWTGACYWHGVGGFMFNSSSSAGRGNTKKLNLISMIVTFHRDRGALLPFMVIFGVASLFADARRLGGAVPPRRNCSAKRAEAPLSLFASLLLRLVALHLHRLWSHRFAPEAPSPSGLLIFPRFLFRPEREKRYRPRSPRCAATASPSTTDSARRHAAAASPCAEVARMNSTAASSTWRAAKRAKRAKKRSAWSQPCSLF